MPVNNNNYGLLLESIGVYEDPVLLKEVVKNILAQLEDEQDKTQRSDEEINLLKTKFKETEERLDKAENEIRTLRNDKTQLYATINQLQENLIQIREEAKRTLQNSRNIAEDYQRRYVLETRQVQKHMENIRQLQEDIDEKTEDADKENKEKIKAQNELQDAQKERNELKNRVLYCHSSHGRLSQVVRETKETNTNLQQQLYSTQKELVTLQVANNTSKANNTKICEEERKKWIEEVSSLQNDIEVLSKRENDQNAFIQILLSKTSRNSDEHPTQIYNFVDENNYVGNWSRYAVSTFPKQHPNDRQTNYEADERRLRNIHRELPTPPEPPHYSRGANMENEQNQQDSKSSSEDVYAEPARARASSAGIRKLSRLPGRIKHSKEKLDKKLAKKKNNSL